MMNLFMVGKGSSPAFSSRKYDPIPKPIKVAMKYIATKAIRIFIAMLEEKDDDLKKAFHSKVMNCLIMF